MIVDEEPEPQKVLSEAFFNKIDREFFAVKRQNGTVDLSESQ